eukprot:scaffold5756_cov99-Cylindrotheca_fusiformis.AAC.3
MDVWMTFEGFGVIRIRARSINRGVRRAKNSFVSLVCSLRHDTHKTGARIARRPTAMLVAVGSESSLLPTQSPKQDNAIGNIASCEMSEEEKMTTAQANAD